MAVFAVIEQPSSNQGRLKDIIPIHCAGRYMVLAPGVWLISFAGTPQGVSDMLKITDGTNGSAVVVEVAGYWGRATTNVWDWFRAFWGGPPNAR